VALERVEDEAAGLGEYPGTVAEDEDGADRPPLPALDRELGREVQHPLEHGGVEVAAE
jgi:hypothetical protein